MKNITKLAEKSGLINMGGYFKEVSIVVFQYPNDTYFRFKYNTDFTDECFKTFDEAINRFNKASEYIIQKIN